MASDQAAVPPAQGMISIDDVLGSQVVNSNGDEVGEIDDLVMQGDSYFAVLSVGGFLGIGDKEVAVPLDELKLGEDKSYLMSPKTEEQLENLPEYRQHDYQQAPRG
jgi:sporulation protein YlmC with PRC-barrel domain